MPIARFQGGSLDGTEQTHPTLTHTFYTMVPGPSRPSFVHDGITPQSLSVYRERYEVSRVIRHPSDAALDVYLYECRNAAPNAEEVRRERARRHTWEAYIPRPSAQSPFYGIDRSEPRWSRYWGGWQEDRNSRAAREERQRAVNAAVKALTEAGIDPQRILKTTTAVDVQGGVLVDGRMVFKATLEHQDGRTTCRCEWGKSWAYLAPHGDPVAASDFVENVSSGQSAAF